MSAKKRKQSKKSKYLEQKNANENVATVVSKTKKQEKQDEINSFWLKHKLLAFLLFVVGTSVYFGSLQHEYAVDDMIVIEENDYTKKGFSGFSFKRKGEKCMG